MTDLYIVSTFDLAPQRFISENITVPPYSYLALYVPLEAFSLGNKSVSFSDIRDVHRHALELLCAMFSPSNIAGSVNAGQNPNSVANPASSDPETTATYSNPLFHNDIPKFEVFLEKIVKEIKQRPGNRDTDPNLNPPPQPTSPQEFMKNKIKKEIERVNLENAYQEILHSASNVKGYRIHILLFDAINLKECANNAFKGNTSREPRQYGTNKRSKGSEQKNNNKKASIFDLYSSWIDCVNDIWPRLKKGEQCTRDNTSFDFTELFDVESAYRCDRDSSVSFEQRNKANYFDSNGVSVHNLKDEIHCPDLFFKISQSMFSSLFSKPLPSYDAISIINIDKLKTKLSDIQSEAEKKVLNLQNNNLPSSTRDLEIKKWGEIIETARFSVSLFNIEKQRHTLVLDNNGKDPYSTLPSEEEVVKQLKQYAATFTARSDNIELWRKWDSDNKGLKEENWEAYSKSRHEQLDTCFQVFKKCLGNSNLYNVTKSALKRLEGYHFMERCYAHENITIFADWFVWLSNFVTNVMDIDYNVLPALQLLILISDAYSYYIGLRLGARIKGETGTGKSFLVGQLTKFCLKQLIERVSNITSKALTGNTRGFSGSFLWRDELSEDESGMKNGKVVHTEKSDALKSMMTDPIVKTFSFEKRMNDDGFDIRSAVMYITLANHSIGFAQNLENKNAPLMRRFPPVSMMKSIKNPDVADYSHIYKEMKHPDLFRQQTDMLQTDQALDVLIEEMMTSFVFPFQPNLKTAEIVSHIVFSDMGLDLDDTTMHFILRAARKLTIKKAVDFLFRSPLGIKNRQTDVGEALTFNIDMLHPSIIEPHLYCDVGTAIMAMCLLSNSFLEHWESAITKVVLYKLCGWEPRHNKLDPGVKFKVNNSAMNPFDYNYVQFTAPNKESIVRLIRETLKFEPSEHDINEALSNLSRRTTNTKLVWEKFSLIESSDDVIFPDESRCQDQNRNVSPDTCTVCLNEFENPNDTNALMKCVNCKEKMHSKNCAVTCTVCNEKMHEPCVPKCKICKMSFHMNCIESEIHSHWKLVKDPTFAQPLVHFDYKYIDPVSNQCLCRLTMAVSTPKDSKEGKFREALGKIGNVATRGKYDVLSFENVYHTFDTKNGRSESKLPSLFKTIRVGNNPNIPPHVIPNFGWVNPASASVLGVDLNEDNNPKNYELDKDLDELMILDHLRNRGYDPKLMYDIHPYHSMVKTKWFMEEMKGECDYKDLKRYPEVFIEAIQNNLKEENRKTSTKSFSSSIKPFSSYIDFEGISRQNNFESDYVNVFKPKEVVKKKKVEILNLQNSLSNSDFFLE
jgi:hypothetical protein